MGNLSSGEDLNVYVNKSDSNSLKTLDEELKTVEIHSVSQIEHILKLTTQIKDQTVDWPSKHMEWLELKSTFTHKFLQFMPKVENREQLSRMFEMVPQLQSNSSRFLSTEDIKNTVIVLEDMFDKYFPHENRQFNLNYVRLYINVFDSIIEMTFPKLMDLKHSKKNFKMNKIYKDLLAVSSVLNEIDFNQELLSQRTFKKLSFKNRVFSSAVWNKFRSTLFPNKSIRKTKLAMLDFDTDFLLDLLLFRIKYTVVTTHKDTSTGQEFMDIYTNQLFPLCSSMKEYYLATSFDFKDVSPSKFGIHPSKFLKDNWDLVMYRISRYQNEHFIGKDSKLLRQNDSNLLRWTLKLIKIITILNTNSQAKRIISKTHFQLLEELFELIKSDSHTTN